MKSSLFIAVCITLSVGLHVAIANPITFVCDAVKEKAWKAKQVVHERQQAVQRIRSQSRLSYSRLVECRPGAVFSAGRAHRCALAQSEVPMQVQVQLNAEDRLYEALADYQEKIRWVTKEECTQDDSIIDQNELSVRIATLEHEIKVLKHLVEELKAE